MVTNKTITKEISREANSDTTISEFVSDREYTRHKIIYNFGSWADAKFKAGIPVDSVECPNCNVHYEHISNHWSTCGEPELSEYQKSLLIGALLSDGSVNENGSMSIYSSNKQFLKWLSDELSFMSYNQKLNDLGSDRQKRNIKSGFDTDRNADYSDVYTITVPKHSFTENLRKWYSSGQKRIPNIQINNDIVKVWYCGDGGLNWSGDKYAYPEIRSLNESDRDDFLESLFDDSPISPSVSNGTMRIYSDADKFLDWIGPAPSGMKYKWENNDRDRYRTMKNQS